MDNIASPRNDTWFVIALATRRAITFLQQQAEVDPGKVGLFGHSMGGKELLSKGGLADWQQGYENANRGVILLEGK